MKTAPTYEQLAHEHNAFLRDSAAMLNALRIVRKDKTLSHHVEAGKARLCNVHYTGSRCTITNEGPWIPVSDWIEYLKNQICAS